MKQDEIIEMARQAGIDIGMWEKLSDDDDVFGYGIDGTHENLETFAKLVAEKATEKANARSNASWTLMCEKMVKAEREACAKVCEELERKATKQATMVGQGCQACAVAIQARGES